MHLTKKSIKSINNSKVNSYFCSAGLLVLSNIRVEHDHKIFQTTNMQEIDGADNKMEVDVAGTNEKDDHPTKVSKRFVLLIL